MIQQQKSSTEKPAVKVERKENVMDVTAKPDKKPDEAPKVTSIAAVS
jgi:hypothetical protein